MSALRDLWAAAQLDAQALDWLDLSGTDPVLPSSFLVSTAAQTGIALAALAAAEIRHARGHTRQRIGVDMRHAAQECSNYLSLDGVVPPTWDKLSGLYRCGPEGRGGWVRVHANFAHHRDGVLTLLDLPTGESTPRDRVQHALERWDALAFEQAASDAGLVVAAVRTLDEWDRHPQGLAIAAQGLFSIEKIGEAPPRTLPTISASDRPLHGLRVLDLTRVLAGPVAGRTLAAYGADVMLVNSPNLPNIPSIAETSRGKLSAHVDLTTDEGQAALRNLCETAHLFIQGYRPGGLAALHFSPDELARLRPGIVAVSLSAYGDQGPWAGKRGFDSLVQTATGLNMAEADAAGTDQPKALPVQILDHFTGYLIAFAAQAALLRQQREGGSWHVRVSLAQTGFWLRHLGRLAHGFDVKPAPFDDLLEASDSSFGRLVAVKHAALFSQTPAFWSRPSMPPGSHPPIWPG